MRKHDGRSSRSRKARPNRRGARAAGHTGRFVVVELLRRGLTPIAVARDATRLRRWVRRRRRLPRGVDRRRRRARPGARGRGGGDQLRRPLPRHRRRGGGAALRRGRPLSGPDGRTGERAGHVRPFRGHRPRGGRDRHPGHGLLRRLRRSAGRRRHGRLAMSPTTSGSGSRSTAGFRPKARAKPAPGTPPVASSSPAGGSRRRLSPRPRRCGSFPAPFGRQTLVELPFSEVPLIARRLRTSKLHTYLNALALRDIRDPSTPAPQPADEIGRSAQCFAVEATVRRSGSSRRILAQGRDIYAVSAPLVCEAVERVLSGDIRDIGAQAPGAVFDAPGFLRALAPDHLTFEIAAA